MNFFQLVLKQMRQRALSTWLTLLSVVLAVALAISIMVLAREAEDLFGQTDYGYDALVGPKGSPLQLVTNTVYHIDKSPGNIPYSIYESLLRSPEFRPLVKIAVPYAVGDSYEGYRIVGTLPKLFGVDDAGQPLAADKTLEYRSEQRYRVAQGRVFHPEKFEAIIGSEIAARTGLKIGSKFKATHGLPDPKIAPDIHEQQWEVVGILEPTRTANDRVLFIPLASFYAITEHERALEEIGKVRQDAAAHEEEDHEHEAEDEHDEAEHDHDEAGEHEHEEANEADHDHDHHDHAGHFTLRDDGTIDLNIPKDRWLVSAVLVKARSPAAQRQLEYLINNRDEATAVNPAMVMRQFFDNFLKGSSLVLLAISLLVTVLAGVSILVSIYNAVSARLREIAILRALGATRARILSLYCVEAGLVGLIGGVVGTVIGHALAAFGSAYFNQRLGEKIDWLRIGGEEWLYLGAVVLLTVLAGLVPALKAYRTPVATNLVAG